jgi:hypothetical protein
VISSVNYANELIGPFYEDDGLREVSLTYTYNSSDFVLEAYEKITIYRGEKVQGLIEYCHSTPLHTLRKGNKYSFSFSFYPTDCFDDIRGAYFDIEIINLMNDTNIDKKSFHLSYAYEDVVNEYFLDEKVRYELEGSFTNLSMLKTLTKEIIDFSNFPFEMSDSPKGVIDTSLFNFKFTSPKSINAMTGTLQITSNTYIFDGIGDIFNRFIFFPFELEQNGTLITFNFTSNYVDPSTLKMSLTPKDGYKKVNNIYIPFSFLNEIEKLEMRIFINDVGLNKTDFDFPLTYYPTRNLIGECFNSDYCLIGGVA